MNATPLTQPLTNALTHSLPQDAAQALLIGRVWQPGIGPVLVRVTPEGVFDLSALAQTCSDLLELPQVASLVNGHVSQRLADTPALLLQSDNPNLETLHFLAPCDLQAIKAAGVTFVSSMLERVIEEQARGDASKAESVRQAVVAVIGDNLRQVKPGSPEAAQLKDVLLAQGVWSQ